MQKAKLWLRGIDWELLEEGAEDGGEEEEDAKEDSIGLNPGVTKMAGEGWD